MYMYTHKQKQRHKTTTELHTAKTYSNTTTTANQTHNMKQGART